MITMTKTAMTTIPSCHASAIPAASLVRAEGTVTPAVGYVRLVDQIVMDASVGSALRGRGAASNATRVEATTGLAFAGTTLLGHRSWSPPS